MVIDLKSILRIQYLRTRMASLFSWVDLWVSNIISIRLYKYSDSIVRANMKNYIDPTTGMKTLFQTSVAFSGQLKFYHFNYRFYGKLLVISVSHVQSVVCFCVQFSFIHSLKSFHLNLDQFTFGFHFSDFYESKRKI